MKLILSRNKDESGEEVDPSVDLAVQSELVTRLRLIDGDAIVKSLKSLFLNVRLDQEVNRFVSDFGQQADSLDASGKKLLAALLNCSPLSEHLVASLEFSGAIAATNTDSALFNYFGAAVVLYSLVKNDSGAASQLLLHRTDSSTLSALRVSAHGLKGIIETQPFIAGLLGDESLSEQERWIREGIHAEINAIEKLTISTPERPQELALLAQVERASIEVIAAARANRALGALPKYLNELLGKVNLDDQLPTSSTVLQRIQEGIRKFLESHSIEDLDRSVHHVGYKFIGSEYSPLEINSSVWSQRDSTERESGAVAKKVSTRVAYQFKIGNEVVDISKSWNAAVQLVHSEALLSYLGGLVGHMIWQSGEKHETRNFASTDEGQKIFFDGWIHGDTLPADLLSNLHSIPIELSLLAHLDQMERSDRSSGQSYRDYRARPNREDVERACKAYNEMVDKWIEDGKPQYHSVGSEIFDRGTSTQLRVGSLVINDSPEIRKLINALEIAHYERMQQIQVQQRETMLLQFAELMQTLFSEDIFDNRSSIAISSNQNIEEVKICLGSLELKLRSSWEGVAFGEHVGEKIEASLRYAEPKDKSGNRQPYCETGALKELLKASEHFESLNIDELTRMIYARAKELDQRDGRKLSRSILMPIGGELQTEGLRGAWANTLRFLTNFVARFSKSS